MAAASAGWWPGWVLGELLLGGWIILRWEGQLGGGALPLNGWFIPKLQSLQPPLPMSCPETRVEELNPGQTFPLSHYDGWPGDTGEGRGTDGNEAVRFLSWEPLLLRLGLQAWSVCTPDF